MKHGHFALYMPSCFWCRLVNSWYQSMTFLGAPFRAIRRAITGGGS